MKTVYDPLYQKMYREKNKANFIAYRNENSEKQKAYMKDYYQRTKEDQKMKYDPKRAKRHQDLRRYGLSQEEVEKMHNDQNCQCAICGKESNRLNIDHNHATKEVRGLLCGQCNRGLGLFEDSIKLLENAKNYLTKNMEVAK